MANTQIELDIYEDFVKRHLQYYGYYSDLRHHRSREKPPSDSDSEVETRSKNYCFNKLASKPALQRKDIKTTQVFYQEEDGKLVPKLKEPRQLYDHVAWSSSLNPPRWPAGIQIIDEEIRHLDFRVPSPEPFYQKTGYELTPPSFSSNGQGRVIFQYSPVVGPYFSGQIIKRGSSARSQVSVDLRSSEDSTLIFESRFESGNLSKVVQVGDYEYELWLRADLYALRHTQWYYFRVSNTQANIKYRFTIINFTKSESLYNFGMKPLFYSEQNAREKSIGWTRIGSDIIYYKNNVTQLEGKTEMTYYSLTWTFSFPHNNDVTYFAHCYPYTYTDLQNYLSSIQQNPRKSIFCRQRVLCRTLAGNNVYTLSITAPVKNIEELKSRKSVIITSRVHPGETNASWVMKGFLDYILDDNPTADLLRKNFLFRIIPMLNPDGVIVGNYRCSLSGRDLNRNYKTTMKDYFPCIWHTKNMIKKLSEDREVVMYCDLHGHSRRQDAFFYGCEFKKNSNFEERVFPYLMAQMGSEQINYKACRFKVQKEKEGTGRVVVWNMGIKNSYTLEATFCGSSFGANAGYHYNQNDFEIIGKQLCDTILAYCNLDPEKMSILFDDIKNQIKESILQHLNRHAGTKMEADCNLESIEIDKFDLSDIESSNTGSDSSPDDEVPLKRISSKLKSRKKKRTSSRLERRKINQNLNKLSETKLEENAEINKASTNSKTLFPKKRHSFLKTSSTDEPAKNMIPSIFKNQVAAESNRVSASHTDSSLGHRMVFNRVSADENNSTGEMLPTLNKNFRYTFGEFVYGGYTKLLFENLTQKFSQLNSNGSQQERGENSLKIDKSSGVKGRICLKKPPTN